MAIMEWNNLLRELNYYLAELYQSDTGYRRTRRIIQGAGMNPGFISAFQGTSVDVWFEIFDYARTRNPQKVTTLLESILTEPDTSDDEFIKGTLKSLKENKNINKGITIKDSEWRAPATTAEMKERIIGRKSTILPIGFLKKGTKSAAAVVRINIGTELGTGFVIKNNWLITNNHVINSITKAKEAKIEFNYQFPEDIADHELVSLEPEKTVALNPGEMGEDGLFFTNIKEDWTIVKIAEDVSDFGVLEFSKKEVAEQDYVNIIQHPSGGPKQLGIYNNMVMYVDKTEEGFIVQYLTDTMPGSSGSPVLNSNWEVVALHHSSGWSKEPELAVSAYRNQGTNIKRIAAFIGDKGLIEK
jgi:V8-like Glu-specific endopeptidase